jgi:hypothetical protein
MQTSNPSRVTVTVDASGTPVCSPDPVRVRGRDAQLMFELQTAGYVFPKDGAVVVSDPGSQFPQPSRTLPPHDTTATLLDRNTEVASFKYTVTVKNIATGQLVPLDPIIQNDA